MTDSELTALWAEKVMGWKLRAIRFEDGERHAWYTNDVKVYWRDAVNPLTSLDDAMRGCEAHPEWSVMMETWDGWDAWQVTVVWNDTEEHSLCTYDPSLPRAIVIAQLRAVGVEI